MTSESRRQFIRKSVSASLFMSSTGLLSATEGDSLLQRTIHSSAEQIPVVGMGSWLTFDVGNSNSGLLRMGQVLNAFVENGGEVIDSSPMYGSSEKVIGKLAREHNLTDKLWVATKVWTNGLENGKRQIRQSRDYFGNIRLNQVHNLRDLEVHYKTLQQLKERGEIKYIGVTHYLNHMHQELSRLVNKLKLDFIQVNFNIENPSAEDRLLPTALDNGVSVIVNRPFQTGRLFRYVSNSKLPSWSGDIGASSWAQFFLKYIISNPAVTCVIPATTQVEHVKENLDSGRGILPTSKQREKMLDYFRSIS